ncbi:MAG TPA: hypothetical protein VIX35_02380 [Vicinamibacterales bacterium]
MMRLRASVVFASVLAASAAAAAQTPPVGANGIGESQAQAPAARAGQPGPGQRAGGQANQFVAIRDVEDALDGRVLIQAQTALQLSDSQYQAFWPKMRELQRVRRQHEQRHAMLINQLNQATKVGAPPVDEATLAARVKALDDLEAAMVSDERTALADVDSVLTVFQRARFRVFEENMEKEKLKLLVKVLATPGGG